MAAIRYGTHKWGGNSKIHLAVAAYGKPARMFSTAVTSQIARRLAGLSEEEMPNIIADKRYDSNAFVVSNLDGHL